MKKRGLIILSVLCIGLFLFSGYVFPQSVGDDYVPMFRGNQARTGKPEPRHIRITRLAAPETVQGGSLQPSSGGLQGRRIAGFTDPDSQRAARSAGGQLLQPCEV